jgi:predicted ribosomally synthesized peptide with SipW-like signal peptide
MNTKIIASLMTIFVVAAAATAGTVAYFSDTEAVEGNAFTAGTLDLTVGATEPIGMPIALGNEVPGNSDLNLAVWALKNDGTINGSLTITTSDVINDENTLYEMETDDITDGEDGGELGARATIAIWVDKGEPGWSEGDYYLTSTEGMVEYNGEPALPIVAYEIVDNFASRTWADKDIIEAGLDGGNFRVSYEWPNGYSEEQDNQAQSDKLEFDFGFKLNQIQSEITNH